MYSIITAVPMRLSWFFLAEVYCKMFIKVRKIRKPQIIMAIPTIKYYRT